MKNRAHAALWLIFLTAACASEPGETGDDKVTADAADAALDAGENPEDSASPQDSGNAAGNDAGPAAGKDAGPTDAGNTAQCKDGDKACSDKSPYGYDECVAGQWQTKICAEKDEVCDQGACVKAKCPVGQKYCDKTVARQCSADGLTSKEIADCSVSGKVCIDGDCLLEPCTAGQSKCQGNFVATCNADGKGYKLQECTSGKVCDGGACKSTVCFEGEVHCESGKVIACNAKKTAFETKDDCGAQGQVCCSGQCGKQVCTPKETKCDGDKAVTCDACGVKWAAPIDCLAKGQTCQKGQCISLVCQPNAAACEGNKVSKKCSADGLSWVNTPCASGEYCTKGACLAPSCELPKTWSAGVQGFSSWSIATSTSDACDLDGNGTKDNAFGGSIGPFAAQINSGLAAQVKAGTGVFLLDAPKWVTDGSKFDIDVINGNLDQTAGACNPAAQSCSFRAFASSYDIAAKSKVCPAKTVLADATVANGKLTSLGPVGKPFQIVLPLGTGADLVLDFHKLRVMGDVTGTSSWQTTKNGRLCGAIRKDQLIQEIDKVPDWFFAQQGLNKATVKALLNALLKLDFDTTGDGKKDAASAALKFTTTGVKVLGF